MNVKWSSTPVSVSFFWKLFCSCCQQKTNWLPLWHVVFATLHAVIQLWYNDPHLKPHWKGKWCSTEVFAVGRPSLQDVVCRLESSTSCVSTPNTSCPWALALINRKISASWTYYVFRHVHRCLMWFQLVLNNLSQSLAKLSVSLEKASAVSSSAPTAP